MLTVATLGGLGEWWRRSKGLYVRVYLKDGGVLEGEVSDDWSGLMHGVEGVEAPRLSVYVPLGMKGEIVPVFVERFVGLDIVGS